MLFTWVLFSFVVVCCKVGLEVGCLQLNMVTTPTVYYDSKVNKVKVNGMTNNYEVVNLINSRYTCVL